MVGTCSRVSTVTARECLAIARQLLADNSLISIIGHTLTPQCKHRLRISRRPIGEASLGRVSSVIRRIAFLLFLISSPCGFSSGMPATLHGYLSRRLNRRTSTLSLMPLSAAAGIRAQFDTELRRQIKIRQLMRLDIIGGAFIQHFATVRESPSRGLLSYTIC
jgi:hypothetical protein